MNEARLLTILKAPHITEKSAQTHSGYRQYVFKVAMDSTKIEIKQAVEHLFKIAVCSVRTCNIKSRLLRTSRMTGRTKAWKKAYVTVTQEYEIDIDRIEV